MRALLFGKDFVARISRGLEVGDEVEEFVFVQAVDEAGGHHGDVEGRAMLDVCSIHGGLRIGGEGAGHDEELAVFTIKYDQVGVEQWAKIESGNMNMEDGGYAMVLDISDNPVVAGKINNAIGQQEIGRASCRERVCLAV